MKLCVKKVYCPNCSQLVKGQESRDNTTVSIICPKCTNTVWIRDGNTWKYSKSGNRKNSQSEN